MRKLLAFLLLVPALAFGQAQLRSGNVAFTGGQISGTKIVGNVIIGGTIAGAAVTGTLNTKIVLPAIDGTLAILGANIFTALQTVTTTTGSTDNGATGNSWLINPDSPTTSAALIRFRGVTTDSYFGRKNNADAFVWGAVGSAPTMTFTPATGALSVTSINVGGSSYAAPLAATTAAIGGGALAAGACASSTVAVTGATTSMAVVTTPNTYPGDGNFWEGYVSAADTVTFKVCASIAQTPASSTYNVRVIQ